MPSSTTQHITHQFFKSTRLLLTAGLALSLMSCGGGSGGGSSGGSQVLSSCNSNSPLCNVVNGNNTDGIGSPGQYANICTPTSEKAWVRAHLNDVYLWYKQIVEVPAANYPTPQTYFDALLVKSLDRFSFTGNADEINSYFDSGAEVGFGYELVNQNGSLRVTYVQPNSPAAAQNLKRGTRIVGINGLAIETLSRDTQIAALYPDKTGQKTVLQVRDNGSLATRTVELVSANITSFPVLQSSIVTTPLNRKLGYLVFTDHIATAEAPLISTLTQFKQAGIDDLVLDLRYNGGGYLYIANEVASMIGGSKVQGRVFEQLHFNDKHPEKTADNRDLFTTRSRSGQNLPQLNLSRVFVLTSARTCSASESIINGLSPFVQVITIGGTTCGKPYGFIQADNCGTAYFAIEFSGVNDAGKGDYVNGFAPQCAASDDLENALGSNSENLLANAINYADRGRCGTSGIAAAPMQTHPVLSNAIEARERAWRQNRLVKPQ
ncbi:S41 family peptidase [Undibacterium cyanobacteriorum]|uniref:S41 family peptidase n=1 Tax=Undibacterium cyanobacteriorum TaxID=3073561 RepID=A0ABY9RG66_9BURK|nr:S41 family peptidase [Undibacterium sp. 20NA77.5]WMW79227.1 S41 family peptidase [Undibacterium sp. 20NA77.5]